MKKQLELFTPAAQATAPAAPVQLTEQQVRNKLYGEVADLANGNLNAVATAVRAVLKKYYYTYVHERGRWIFLKGLLTRRARRAIRDTQKLMAAENTRVRA